LKNQDTIVPDQNLINSSKQDIINPATDLINPDLSSSPGVNITDTSPGYVSRSVLLSKFYDSFHIYFYVYMYRYVYINE
jgi:hypothetical protein